MLLSLVTGGSYLYIFYTDYVPFAGQKGTAYECHSITMASNHHSQPFGKKISLHLEKTNIMLLVCNQHPESPFKENLFNKSNHHLLILFTLFQSFPFLLPSNTNLFSNQITPEPFYPVQSFQELNRSGLLLTMWTK